MIEDTLRLKIKSGKLSVKGVPHFSINDIQENYNIIGIGFYSESCLKTF